MNDKNINLTAGNGGNLSTLHINVQYVCWCHWTTHRTKQLSDYQANGL